MQGAFQATFAIEPSTYRQSQHAKTFWFFEQLLSFWVWNSLAWHQRNQFTNAT